MKTFKFLSLLLMLLLASGMLSSGMAHSQFEMNDADNILLTDLMAPQIPVDQLIIKYRDTEKAALEGPTQVNEMERLSSVAGIDLAYARAMSGDAHVLRLPKRMSESDVAIIAARLAALPDVAYAEPDAVFFPTITEPDDPAYDVQWHYHTVSSSAYGINAPAAWDIVTGTSNIVVAVLDTGITQHPDLDSQILPGYDFISNLDAANDGNGRDNDPSDPGDWVTEAENTTPGGVFEGCGAYNSSWHGTHVAGTIGASTNNTLGVAGINWNASILPVRVLGKCGGDASDTADAIRWAAGLSVSGVPANANPAKVINLSLGAPGECPEFYQEAINDALQAGTTIVVSAGNSYDNAGVYRPASCDGVITVAASTRQGAMAYYSNYDSTVEITAPGGDVAYDTELGGQAGILSTLNDGVQGPGDPNYVYYQGTSMSAPHVSGVASLLLSANPGLSPSQVSQILQETATQFPTVSSCPTIDGAPRPSNWCQCTTATCGNGILNAFGAVSPLITDLAPRNTSPDSGPLTLTVYGANFNDTAQIYFDGEARGTYFVSSTELTTTLSLADTQVNGSYPVTVSGDYGAAGTLTSSAKAFSVGENTIAYLPLVMKPEPVVLPANLPVVEDVDIFAANPNIYPDSETLYVGHHWADCFDEHDTDWGPSRSLLKFDVSTIPSTASISQATLNFFVGSVCNYTSQNGTARQVAAYRVLTPWAENNVSWAAQPGIAPEIFGSATVLLDTADFGYHTMDLTALVQGWVNGSLPNYGFMLLGPEASDVSGALIQIGSSEHSAEYIPYLTITYNGMLNANDEPYSVNVPVECKVTGEMMTCGPVNGFDLEK